MSETWTAIIYAVTYRWPLETDIQDEPIQSLERRGNEVWITSERGRHFALELKTHGVRPG